MHSLRKYTQLWLIFFSFALIFSFLFSYATPHKSRAFAQDFTTNDYVRTAPRNAVAFEGEFLVGFTNSQTLNEIKKGQNPSWMSKLGDGVSVDTALSRFDLAKVTVTNPAGDGQWENLANILSSDPNVAFVEPNYVVHGFGKPNDPYVKQLWYLDKTSAFKAWDQSRRGEEIIVAVIDSGIHITHEELQGKIWINRKETPDNGIDDDNNGFVDDIVGWDYYEGDNFPMPNLVKQPRMTSNGDCVPVDNTSYYPVHGTHVAGTIASVADNAIGVAGVAPNVKIMALRTLGGSCGSGAIDDSLRAVIYAINNGAQIINMSLGSYHKTESAVRVYEHATREGVLVIAAAGNESNDNNSSERSYPASYDADGILSVAASAPDDKLAEFSNYGRTTVDLAAPGVGILNLAPIGSDTAPRDGYVKIGGTSMAAPVVSGAAALLLSQDPKLSNLQLKAKLMNAVDRVPALRGKVVSNGRLNIERALHASTAYESPDKENPGPRRTDFGSSSQDTGGIRIFDNRSR